MIPCDARQRRNLPLGPPFQVQGVIDREEFIMTLPRIALSGILLALLSLTSGCVVHTREGYNEGYREGYYDREHNRWYHNHEWRDCVERDEHCR
jgi:hypothetical protein